MSRLAFFSNRNAGGRAVSGESAESREDSNYRVISFAECGDVTPLGLPVTPLNRLPASLIPEGFYNSYTAVHHLNPLL